VFYAFYEVKAVFLAVKGLISLLFAILCKRQGLKTLRNYYLKNRWHSIFKMTKFADFY
jgi:hypothetical protein